MFDRIRTAQPSPSARTGRARPRLTLELLEDRLAPATLTVNSTADTAHPTDPYLSLREAIRLVNLPALPNDLSPQILAQISGPLHQGHAATIAFDPTTVTGPITLTGTQLELTLPATVARVTIDGGDGVIADGNNASRVLQVAPGVQAALESVTVMHGQPAAASQLGGGIYNAGTLTVSGCTISSCSAARGGGIYNDGGTLTLTGCTVSLDSATGSNGGGIGDIGTLTVINSVLDSNTSRSAGGAIEIDGGPAVVTGCTLSHNGGNSGIGISGGAINNFGGTLTVSNCTLGSNSGESGGAISNRNTLTVSNCTLSANSARVLAGGIDNSSGAPLSLRNTIVAGNPGGDIAGSYTQSYSLIGGNPLLAPLGDYGGPTQTMPLLPGSPALDAGDPGLAGSPDQRGVVRSGGVNIGAFQASAARFVVTAPDTVSAGAAFDVTVSAVDPYDQQAVGYTGSITFSSADPHGATLPDDYTFTLADAGSHTFVALTILYTAGIQDVTASDTTNNLSGSANVNVVAGSAVAFVVTAPANAVAGTPFDVTVTAMDAFGNVASGYTGTVTFTSTDTDPGVVLPPDYTFQPSDGGVVTFAGGVTLFTSGQQTLTVTDLESGITGTAVVTL
jgi:hypothetical protein